MNALGLAGTLKYIKSILFNICSLEDFIWIQN